MSLVWVAASFPYFIYIVAMAALMRGVDSRARLASVLIALAGMSLATASLFGGPFWARLVVAPPVVLILAYYASGSLWSGPMPGAERFLGEADRALRIPRIAARIPRAVVVLLELAYAAVYPVIPIALGLYLWFSPSADADRFWTVMLVTDYICFAALPWIQTRPPRALEAAAPWSHGLRSFNLAFLGRASHGVNTVPSGHAAEALAAALLVSDAPWPVAATMWIVALAISAGAVFGRYHYAVDAVAGWAVALVVYFVIG